jgi:hypothetical protein
VTKIFGETVSMVRQVCLTTLKCTGRTKTLMC